MEEIIFLHSKGGETRRKILQLLLKQKKDFDLHTLSSVAIKLEISKPGLKKHIDYLHKLDYIDKINPKSKPVFLRLTDKGLETAKKYIFY